MRKLILTFSICFFSYIGFAQYNWDFGVSLGASNYLGEMGGKSETRRGFVADMKLSQTNIVVGGMGAFGRYRVLPRLYAKAGLNWIRIEGADNLSTNPGRVGRNLSFKNEIVELELTAQYVFYEIADLGKTMRFRNDFRMYAFAGIAGFYNNPKAEYQGKYVALQPLKTEGVSYSKIQASIPLGIGVYATIDKKHRIGWELDWRTTFTDYLDDVSTVYADPASLDSETAIALANRRDELGEQEGVPHAANYAAGQKRGDPSHKDSYITTSFSYSYVLRGKSSIYKARYGSVFKGNGSKKRRVRAKF